MLIFHRFAGFVTAEAESKCVDNPRDDRVVGEGEPRLRWLFLDLNSYFASVEQELVPRLRGRPVAVVPVLADTTCCIAASYEAKAFGVKTGTQVGEAKRIARASNWWRPATSCMWTTTTASWKRWSRWCRSLGDVDRRDGLPADGARAAAAGSAGAGTAGESKDSRYGRIDIALLGRARTEPLSLQSRERYGEARRTGRADAGHPAKARC